jgi:hypothetical protein
MKIQKAVSRRKTLHETHAAQFESRLAAQLAVGEPEDSELEAQDGDSVPQPIDDWADDDDANRWLHEHRFDGGEPFDIN